MSTWVSHNRDKSSNPMNWSCATSIDKTCVCGCVCVCFPLNPCTMCKYAHCVNLHVFHEVAITEAIDIHQDTHNSIMTCVHVLIVTICIPPKPTKLGKRSTMPTRPTSSQGVHWQIIEMLLIQVALHIPLHIVSFTIHEDKKATLNGYLHNFTTVHSQQPCFPS